MINTSIDETDIFLQKCKEEKTKEEIMNFFCEKIKEETKETDITKAWQKWKEMHKM